MTINSSEGLDLSITATDSDVGDKLTIQAPELSPLPDGLTLVEVSNGQSRLSGTPVAGTYTIKLEVVDSAGARDEWTFTLTVVDPNVDGNVNGAGVGDSTGVTTTTTTTVTTTAP